MSRIYVVCPCVAQACVASIHLALSCNSRRLLSRLKHDGWTAHDDICRSFQLQLNNLHAVVPLVVWIRVAEVAVLLQGCASLNL